MIVRPLNFSLFSFGVTKHNLSKNEDIDEERKTFFGRYLVSVVIHRLTGEIPDVERKSLTIPVD